MHISFIYMKNVYNFSPTQFNELISNIMNEIANISFI